MTAVSIAVAEINIEENDIFLYIWYPMQTALKECNKRYITYTGVNTIFPTIPSITKPKIAKVNPKRAVYHAKRHATAKKDARVKLYIAGTMQRNKSGKYAHFNQVVDCIESFILSLFSKKEEYICNQFIIPHLHCNVKRNYLYYRLKRLPGCSFNFPLI